jgi:polysaccharide export outer membrane protein
MLSIASIASGSKRRFGADRGSTDGRSCLALRISPSLLAVILLLLLGGCAVTPVSGPQSWDISPAQPELGGLPYAVVKLNPAVLSILKANAPRIAGSFKDRRRSDGIRFGVGDLVGITVYEAGAGGLFFPNEPGTIRTGNFVALPSQTVDSHGDISVPYAGAIHVAGRTAVDVQKTIVDALKRRALEPQAIVTLLEQRATSVSVLGDVRSGGRFPLVTDGERLLESIARAGGPSSAGFDTWVVLERDGKRAMAPFGALIDEPANNINVRPRDIIYVFREPQTFLAFGASGRQGQFGFEAWRVSLSEAVGKASGLNDGAADPGSVFIYRGETRQVAESMGIDISAFDGPIISVIYQLNLRDPAGYFLASGFEIRNKDVIYVSNAASVETSKFLNFIRLIVATANDPIIAANGAVALKNAINGASTTTIVQSTQSVQ